MCIIRNDFIVDGLANLLRCLADNLVGRLFASAGCHEVGVLLRFGSVIDERDTAFVALHVARQRNSAQRRIAMTPAIGCDVRRYSLVGFAPPHLVS